MPLVKIDLTEGKSLKYREQVGDCIYQAMRETLNVPENDRFILITEHRPGNLQFDRNYLGIAKTDENIFIQITLNTGGTVELKRNFYRAVVDKLVASVKIRQEDVFISLVEVPKENWSFGNGEAQYAMP
ncbi:MAG: tautomerase family protein [Candidatus Obscuribacterales bacterium]|nr:tautomerase family protein [Candidatus Obscuribacterales bacterium]